MLKFPVWKQVTWIGWTVPSDCESFNGDIVLLLVGQKNLTGSFYHHFLTHSIALDKIILCIIENFSVLYIIQFWLYINPILIVHNPIFWSWPSIWSFHNACWIPQNRALQCDICGNIILNNPILNIFFSRDGLYKSRIMYNGYQTLVMYNPFSTYS